MQAPNKADFTQANVRWTLLETRRAARPGHSRGWRGSFSCLPSAAGAAGRAWDSSCSPCPEPFPLLIQATRTLAGTQRQTEVWGTFLHYRCESGKDHAEDWEIQLVCFLHCFFFFKCGLNLSSVHSRKGEGGRQWYCLWYTTFQKTPVEHCTALKILKGAKA